MIITFYRARENWIAMQLTEDNAPANMADIQKIEVITSAGVLSSETSPTVITLLPDKVGLFLGRSSLVPGVYSSRIVAYSTRYPDGVVFSDGTSIEIR